MLSISKMAGGQEAYYLELSRGDYYLRGGEPLGEWFGNGARALGLVGEVTADSLSAVLEGRGLCGERLHQEQRWRSRARQPGWDLTFSAPKSVSTLWSQVSPLLRAEIEAAHGDAVRAALVYLEDAATFTRRGQAGIHLERAKLVIATFLHGTSRAQDPQLHTHALAANATQRLDGTWGALRSRDLYQHKMTAGALYRAELAHGLRQRLGLELTRENSWFKVLGVPDALIKAFSCRRQAIEEALAEHGWSGARASDFLARTTREVKRHVAREELDHAWSELGIQHGSRTQAEQLIGRQRPCTAHEEKQAVDRAVRRALSDLVQGHGFFAERELVRRAANALQAVGVSTSVLLGRIREVIEQEKDLIQLPAQVTGGGGRQYASARLIADQRRLFELVDRGRDSARHVVDDAVLARALAKFPTIKDEQRAALAHVTMEPGAVKCVSGWAGTGKTFALRAAATAWRAAGYEVHGAALGSRTGPELEKGRSLPPRTVTSLLGRLEREATDHSRSIFVLDEAGMLGTSALKRLLEAILNRGGKVVLVGDASQLQPIEAGAPFAALCARLGSAELKDVARQYELWQRHAAQQVREGDVRGALTQFALAERLHIAPDRESAMRELVDGWVARRSADPAQNLILAGTRADVARLNVLVQAKRIELGELDPQQSLPSSAVALHVGDRVMFTRNMRALGVVNGDFGTIEALHPRSLLSAPSVQVRLDRAPREGSAGRSIHVTAPLQGENAPQLAYCSTTHKAQGANLDRTWVLAGGWMQDRELSYVQMSRARERCDIYTTESDAGEDLVELERAMERSRRKEMLPPEVMRHMH